VPSSHEPGSEPESCTPECGSNESGSNESSAAGRSPIDRRSSEVIAEASRASFLGGSYALPSESSPSAQVQPPPLPALTEVPAPATGASEARGAAAPRPAKREHSGFLEALVLVVGALVMALTLKTYVAEAYEIKGRSMEPTFINGERVVVLKSFYGIVRGDIIVFASTEDPTKDLIKRVIGLPGETIEIARGKVTINGRALEETYELTHDARELRDTPHRERIPEGHYYVLGDNRPDSHDSRNFLSIPAVNIKGKVVARWWPFGKLRTF
jgi:signal peptidase I